MMACSLCSISFDLMSVPSRWLDCGFWSGTGAPTDASRSAAEPENRAIYDQDPGVSRPGLPGPAGPPCKRVTSGQRPMQPGLSDT